MNKMSFLNTELLIISTITERMWFKKLCIKFKLGDQLFSPSQPLQKPTPPASIS
jgi:hypothetical protein